VFIRGLAVEFVFLRGLKSECVCDIMQLNKHKIFVGGSSGAVFSAIKKYFSDKKFDRKPNVVTLFADRGDRYANTIYNDEWCGKFIY